MNNLKLIPLLIRAEYNFKVELKLFNGPLSGVGFHRSVHYSWESKYLTVVLSFTKANLLKPRVRLRGL